MLYATNVTPAKAQRVNIPRHCFIVSAFLYLPALGYNSRHKPIGEIVNYPALKDGACREYPTSQVDQGKRTPTRYVYLRSLKLTLLTACLKDCAGGVVQSLKNTGLPANFDTGGTLNPTGKKEGTWLGRVAIRKTGNLNVQNSAGAVQGIHHQHCRLITNRRFRLLHSIHNHRGGAGRGISGAYARHAIPPHPILSKGWG